MSTPIKQKGNTGIVVSKATDRQIETMASAVLELSTLDYHIGAKARDDTLRIITVLRDVQIPDEDIRDLLETQTGLNRRTIAGYLASEVYRADKLVGLRQKYGPMIKRRFVNNGTIRSDDGMAPSP